MLNEHANEISKRREQNQIRNKELQDGIENPNTLDDYQRLLKSKANEIGKEATFTQARMAMKLEHRIRFDELAAEFNRNERKKTKELQREQSLHAPGQPVETTEIIKTVHTKHNHDLWQFQMTQRVSSEEFKLLAEQARKLGGNYSSYRGNGAIPGWQFRTEEGAKAFKALINGDLTQAKNVIDERYDVYADNRSQSAIERLNEMADALEQRANQSLNQDRKENTYRRAMMAARAELSAKSDLALAQTMRNISLCIEDGKANFLSDVRQKIQVETLREYMYVAQSEMLRAQYSTYAEHEKRKDDPISIEVADYVVYPSYTVYRSDLANIGRTLLQVEGTKRLGQQVMKVADDTSEAYYKFAKDNLDTVAVFNMQDGERAVLATKGDAESVIARSGYCGKAVVLPFKRGQNYIILSPSESLKRGIWNGDNDKRITLHPDVGAELVEKIGKVEKRGEKITVPWQLMNAYENRKRLERMNIETPSELRAALREFINLREAPKEVDKIKKMEREMIGRAIPPLLA